MTAEREQESGTRSAIARRNVLAAAAAAPVLAGVGAHAARALPPPVRSKAGVALIEPVSTTEADWKGVAKALGRGGSLMRKTVFRTGFGRTDLHVVSRDVQVTAGLALGSHAAFIRYSDGSTLMMGDIVSTEDELQPMLDTMHAHGIRQTAIHKHLLAHSPDMWWTHVHGHGKDAAALAAGLREALDCTGTPAGVPPSKTPPPVDLDTAGIDRALGAKGSNDQGIYKCVFARRERISDGGLLLPAGSGATSAFNFQPLGHGRAALNGDFAMIAEEVHDVLKALRKGGIEIVELHNHGLTDEPRLFFTHLWAVDDAVKIAKALRSAVDCTNVTPTSIKAPT
ncbi:DUF1259 domain-containing protein [Streptoverticillium reticulum]|uniref:DUF1259 domain-containing protein n=1 Tax=Streptoverticillium reticulum TaxID=1433415 RepID=UPI0039BFE2DA